MEVSGDPYYKINSPLICGEFFNFKNMCYNNTNHLCQVEDRINQIYKCLAQ